MLAADRWIHGRQLSITFSKHLLGHFWVLQDFSWVDKPWQFPPYFSVTDLDLDLVFVPLPHVLEHGEYRLQLSQTQFTKRLHYTVMVFTWVYVMYYFYIFINYIYSKGIYDRLPLIMNYLLDIDLALWSLFLPWEVKFNKSWNTFFCNRNMDSYP